LDKKRLNKLIVRFLWITLTVFLILNIIASFHAYKFTHFDTSSNKKTKDGHHLSIAEKLKTLLFGINNPRPKNLCKPVRPFKVIDLQSNKRISCWLIQTQHAKGTVILFHGYGGEKSSMLNKADVFMRVGYNVMLVDFMGSGSSEGTQTTIGFYEAKEVKTAIDYLQKTGEKNIFLFGTSMGSVAIMKCIYDYHPYVKGIIIECPFGSMLRTVQARFASMRIPSFPMANLLVFWGGIENNFNAFKHTPIVYASQINIPVLLMYGQKDEKVSQQEINEIYKNLKGPKRLLLLPLAGHEDYLKLYENKWTTAINSFLIDVYKSSELH
jgi:alpha-beta hydrolase superfamily lysophospholipase